MAQHPDDDDFREEGFELTEEQKREFTKLYAPLIHQAERIGKQFSVQLAPEVRRVLDQALGLQKLSEQGMAAWQQAFDYPPTELPDFLRTTCRRTGHQRVSGEPMSLPSSTGYQSCGYLHQRH